MSIEISLNFVIIGFTLLIRSSIKVTMNQLSTDKRAAIVRALVEGNSVRATCRIVGVAKGTVLKLLPEIGVACRSFHDLTIRDVRAKRVQCDEVWGFCYSKARNVPPDKAGQAGFGDVWTWT